MNEHSLNDPLLQSLEARLASAMPAVSPGEQQRMLYECAFAAGHRSGTKVVRGWQLATASLAIAVFVVSLPRFTAGPVVAQPRVEPSPIDVAPAPERLIPSEPLVATIRLDAWQLPAADDDSVSQSLAQMNHPDVGQSSLTVGKLTRQFKE